MTDEAPMRYPLTIGISIITLLLFGVLPLLWLGQMVSGSNPPTLLILLGFWFFLVSWLVLGTPASYGIVCGALLGLSTYAFLREKGSWWQRILLLGAVASVLTFMLWPYEPAVQPATGYQLTLLTQPSLLANGLARAESIGEQKPCRYEILGWHTDTFYYRSQCTMQLDDLWSINPQQMTKPQRFQGEMPPLYSATLDTATTWSMIHAVAAYPPDTDLRSLYVPAPGMQSPDGTWTAMVSKHLYGREDVILISKSR